MLSGPRQGKLRWLSPLGYRTLNWWEWGPAAGAPVICVHGLTRNARDFDVLAEALATQGRRVFCPDLPGHGGSEWLGNPSLYQPPSYIQALSHLLARLEGQVDWVGTSLGGICGMGVAATPGNAIRRLVLNDVGSMIPRAAIARIRAYLSTEYEFAGLAELEAHLRFTNAEFGALTDAQWAAMARHSSVPVGNSRFRLNFDPAIVAPMHAVPVADVHMGAYWRSITAPVLVLRGEHSDLLLPETARQMASRPGVRVETIPGCGHAPGLMDPTQLQLVAEFLKAICNGRV